MSCSLIVVGCNTRAINQTKPSFNNTTYKEKYYIRHIAATAIRRGALAWVFYILL